MESRTVYADNAATTSLSVRALERMLPYMSERYGNPSSAHEMGHDAKKAVEDARGRIARVIGAKNNEIFFTSGGTEADNWALYGALKRREKKGGHIITTRVEHSAVFRTAEDLEKRGCRVTYLSTDKYGQVTSEQLSEAICDDTALVSIMLANNEIGSVLPIKELCAAAHARGVLFHTDAVQAVGHIPVNVGELGVDFLSMSAHKFHGPKGVGALYVRLGSTLPPIIIGGGQEKGRRSGTENVPGIVGMAAALEESAENIVSNMARVTAMRDRIIDSALKIPGVKLTGDPVNRLPGIASFLFEGLTSAPIVRALSEVGIFASSASACSSGSTEVSRALSETIGTNKALQHGALRLSLNEYNTDEDIDYILEMLPYIAGKLYSGLA